MLTWGEAFFQFEEKETDPESVSHVAILQTSHKASTSLRWLYLSSS